MGSWNSCLFKQLNQTAEIEKRFGTRMYGMHFEGLLEFWRIFQLTIVSGPEVQVPFRKLKFTSSDHKFYDLRSKEEKF